MSETATSMVERRSRLRATVVLTRRLNIELHSLGDEGETGIDLLGNICTEQNGNTDGFLPFGIIVWGTTKELETEEEAAKFARALKKKIPASAFFMPVIVLLFSMQKDEAFFSWFVEPCNDSSKLCYRKELAFSRFDIKQLDKMIVAIKKWYQQMRATILVDAAEPELTHS